MNINLEINNLSSCNFSKKKLKLAVEETVKKTDLVIFFKKNVLLSVGILSEAEMKKINYQYRKKNSPTDVLSFANFNNHNDLIEAGKEDIFLGEILLCCADIEKYCKENNFSFEKEFLKVTSHGVLHLLGFSHGEKMFEIQERVSLDLTK